MKLCCQFCLEHDWQAHVSEHVNGLVPVRTTKLLELCLGNPLYPLAHVKAEAVSVQVRGHWTGKRI